MCSAEIATYNRNDSGLASGVLRSPCKVSGFEAEGTVFHVPATDADGVDTLGSKFGACGLTTELKLSLFAVVGALSTGLRTLVAG